MYCTVCGSKLNDEALFCSQCGNRISGQPLECAANEEGQENQAHAETKVKCERCGSFNLQMQSRSAKGFPVVGFTVGVTLLFAGLGLMFLSIIGLVLGAIIGAVLGGIIGILIYALVPKAHETVAVCQNCGFTSKPIPQAVKK